MEASSQENYDSELAHGLAGPESSVWTPKGLSRAVRLRTPWGGGTAQTLCRNVSVSMESSASCIKLWSDLLAHSHLSCPTELHTKGT